MWRPLIPRLEGQFRVIAPDLPGIGESDVPTDGLDLTSAARRIHSLMAGLDIRTSIVVGHDIGLMVAYAYAALFPAETQKLVLMDAFIPGVDGWEAIHNHPGLWHFRFHGSTPEALVSGRERTYFDYYWNEFAADRTRSHSPRPIARPTPPRTPRPGRMRSAWSYFDSFSRAAVEFAQFARTRLAMPVLTIGGDRANGHALGEQGKLVAVNASAVVLANTGHWLMEENTQETIDALLRFF